MGPTTVNKPPAAARKPAIMLSKMAARNQEVRAVGAWVEVEPVYDKFYPNAVASAQREEARVQQQKYQKDLKLQQFQKDVKKRVQMLEKFKQEQQLQKSYKAVEVERNVVRQSAFAAEKSTPRKNRCTLRSDEHLQIKQSGPLNSQGCIITEQSGDEEEKLKLFEEHSNQIRKHNRQARRHLTSHRVKTGDMPEHTLPGGVWREGPTLDHPASRLTADSNVIQEAEFEEESLDEDSETTDDNKKLASRSVQFDLENKMEDTRQARIGRKSANQIQGSDLHRLAPVPDIYPGVQSEEEKIQTQNQRAMYRRLFMDIEREQVKENLRRLDHRKKINQLKKTKEKERLQLEEQAQRFVMTHDPQVEAQYEQRQQETELQRSLEHREKQAQKTRETERYLEALKVNLRDKINKQGIELPALCCCGETVWDTHPDTCANNCFFYKNHKAYAKALSSLLTSCEMV